jgi:DNA-binding response OmpR family regulator
MVNANKSSPILIVEDDRKTASLLALYLEREGFKTVSAYNGEDALQLARSHSPIFVILDLMLPKVDGWEVCRELRYTSDVPILILTAREEEMDRLLGLNLGADDYVSKPFSPLEVVARVKAILRRARLAPAKPKTLLTAQGLTLDLAKRHVTLSGRPVSLTLLEYRLLEALMAAPGRVFTREELLNSLHPGGESVIDRVVDVHIGKLRQKIESDPSRPSLIETVRGLGYRFTESHH